MAKWKKHLEDDELDVVRKAAINAKFATDAMLNALLAEISPAYAATLQGGGLPPAARLLVQLNQLNSVHNLRNGDVPLQQWLNTAIRFAGDIPETEVFEDALDLLRPDPSDLMDDNLVKAASLGGGFRGGGDDGNLELDFEAQIAGSDETVSVSFLEDAMRSARSVVKILVHRHEDGDPVFLAGDEPQLGNGTAWFIGPNLLITNHHVINVRRSGPDATALDFRLQAESAQILYDYLKSDEPSSTAVAGPGALMASDKALDFAILRVPDPAEPREPLRLRGRVIKKRIEQALGTRVNLLQHPNGKPMRLGFRDNFVVIGDDQGLSYLTDTDRGSSGSPVCDDKWFVAALHSHSRSVSDQDLKIRGRKVRRENRGIPIPTIMKHLEANHPDLHAEIEAAQD